MRTFLTDLISLASIGLLGGCATQAQQAAYAKHEMERTMAVYGPACEKLGYTANTDSWRNCVMQLSYKNDMQGYGFVASPYWVY